MIRDRHHKFVDMLQHQKAIVKHNVRQPPLLPGTIELFEEGAGGFGFCGGGVAFGFGDVISDIGESGGGR